MKTLPVCKHDKNCGGCTYQGIPYEEQLKIKEEQSLKFLKDRGIRPDTYLPICASKEIYRYRNKMEYTFGDMEKGGEMTLGMHQKGRYMNILTVDSCQLVHEDYNKVLNAVLSHAKEKGYTKYHKRRHDGLLRHLIVRTGINTNEILIAIVTTSDPDGIFDEEAFTERILAIPDMSHEIAGIVRVFNDGIADTVKCDAMKTLYGRSYYNERIMGLNFKVGILSFFQTNINAVERLYSDAISLIDDYENKNAFDLFCGTGTISQAMAKKAGHVVGVEIVEEAVNMAKQSAADNGLENCEFICGDVFEVLDGFGAKSVKPDVIVVDPPRAGISNKALEKIAAYGVDQIVYVSCNPKTLSENLQFLEYAGYKTKHLRFYDNFPFTSHVETVVLLSRTSK